MSTVTARVLVTGAFGQIGTELTEALRSRHGSDNVLATGRHVPEQPEDTRGPTATLDVTDASAVRRIIESHEINVVYHLAAILSARGEHGPDQTWQINMQGLRNVLEATRSVSGCRVFWPSSIAAFGPDTPLVDTPQDTVMRPTTIYGVTKVAGELLCD